MSSFPKSDDFYAENAFVMVIRTVSQVCGSKFSLVFTESTEVASEIVLN